MKNTLMAITMGALAITAFAANASDVSNYLNKKTDTGFNSIIQTAYASDSGRNKIFQEIQASINDSSSAQQVSNANELLINVTSMVFPQFAGYWDNVATWSNVPVYQNHDLFDMDRQSLPTGIRTGKNSVSIPDHQGSSSFADGNSISTTSYGTTDFLMKNGQPAPGPDGMPIQLCRFFKSKFSPYAEISYSDAKALFPILQGQPYSNSCLSSSLTSTYWKSRHNDFYDNFGGLKRPANTIDRF